MALKMPKLFGEAKPKLAAADMELDMPTTQVKLGASAQSGYAPLASVSVMEQLRAATAKSIAPWKLPLLGDHNVANALAAALAALLPMGFVGGLMGPYMRPIPVGSGAAMLFSLAIAFIVTPWAAIRMLGWGRKRSMAGEGASGTSWSVIPS